MTIQQPTTFPGETTGASGSGTTIDDALDFNSLPRRNQRTPPPVMENTSDLISPSRVIRNPRDLTSPRPSSAHDPFADSTYSRLDFQDQNRDGGLSGHRSPDFDQSSNIQDDVFGESALRSSWAGPSLSGTRGCGQWGSFRDHSFSTVSSHVCGKTLAGSSKTVPELVAYEVLSRLQIKEVEGARAKLKEHYEEGVVSTIDLQGVLNRIS